MHENLNIVWCDLFYLFCLCPDYHCAFLYFHFCFRPAKIILDHHVVVGVWCNNNITLKPIFFLSSFCETHHFPIKARHFYNENKVHTVSDQTGYGHNSLDVVGLFYKKNKFCFCWIVISFTFGLWEN